ncbi:putative Protein RMD5 like protein [Fusarium oxysporum f. sp. albedinis]|nr:putative Protein RMD5 like protein [Fusarium oxysporum f. sp. albedinis]
MKSNVSTKAEAASHACIISQDDRHSCTNEREEAKIVCIAYWNDIHICLVLQWTSLRHRSIKSVSPNVEKRHRVHPDRRKTAIPRS